MIATRFFVGTQIQQAKDASKTAGTFATALKEEQEEDEYTDAKKLRARATRVSCLFKYEHIIYIPRTDQNLVACRISIACCLHLLPTAIQVRVRVLMSLQRLTQQEAEAAVLAQVNKCVQSELQIKPIYLCYGTGLRARTGRQKG